MRITPVSGTVNVRAAPGATAAIIGAVVPGQVVEVIEANAEGKIGNQSNQQWVEIRLSDGRIYDVEFRFPGNTWESGQERMQTQVDGRRFFHVKGGLGAPACNWEELWYDNDFIWRGTDISPNEDEYYQASEDGTYGQHWTPRKVSVGTLHFAKPVVTFRRKSDGALVPGKTPYQFPHWIEIRALHPEYTFESGVKLQNVVEIWGYLHDEAAHAPGLNFERYWYAKGFGLVGWQDPAKNWRSYIKTPSVNVGNLVGKVVPGLTLPALPASKPVSPPRPGWRGCPPALPYCYRV